MSPILKEKYWIKWKKCGKACRRILSFFHKLRNIDRFYRQASKKKTMVNKKMKLDTLEVATANLHGDINNSEKQGEVNRLREVMGNIENRKPKGVAIRSRAKWLQMEDRCLKEFFRTVRPINTQATIRDFKDRRGQCFIKMGDLERITKYFYKELYAHKDISEGTLVRVMEEVPATFTNSMTEALSEKITEKELQGAVNSMAKEKTPGHDDIPVEFFQKKWYTLGKDLHLMVKKNIEEKKLHKEVTKGLIFLIPKEGDAKDLNYWRPIALFTVTYNFFAKALQIRLQPMLRDIISPDKTAFLSLRFILDNIVLTL